MCVLACCLWQCVCKSCVSTCGGNAAPPLASLRGCCGQMQACNASCRHQQANARAMQERCSPSYYEALAWAVQPVMSCAGSCRRCAGRPGQGGGCLCRGKGLEPQRAEHAARAAVLLKRQMLCWSKGVGVYLQTGAALQAGCVPKPRGQLCVAARSKRGCRCCARLGAVGSMHCIAHCRSSSRRASRFSRLATSCCIARFCVERTSCCASSCSVLVCRAAMCSACMSWL